MVTLGIRIMANLPDRKDGQRRVAHGGQSGHFYLAESGHFYLGITFLLPITGLLSNRPFIRPILRAVERHALPVGGKRAAEAPGMNSPC
jgi:hypothetical protein